MGASRQTLARMRERVEKLKADFTACLSAFDAARLFTGPSVYFHCKTLAIRQRHPTVAETLKDDEFFDALYATLTAWGMHRMGPGGAKLVEFDVMKASLQSLAPKIGQVESRALFGLEKPEVPDMARQLWSIIAELKVSASETRIVAGAKALHHLLPRLVPPIDRNYTIRFFYHHTTLNRGDEAAFLEIYPHFVDIAQTCRALIEPAIKPGSMSSSESKLIDNAIVGFALKYLKTSEPDQP